MTLIFSLGTYTQTLTSHALPDNIGGGNTVLFTFSVDVDPASATGFAVIDASVSGVGMETGIPTSDTSAATTDSWTVQTPANLSINTISTAPTLVSQGQTGITVTMTVENTGEAAANISSASLTFTAPTAGDVTSEYTITPSGGNPTTIAGGTTGTFSFTVDVSGTATTGELITIDGTIYGTDANSAALLSDSSALTPDSWTVQLPANLSINTISTVPTTVSQGQTNITVTMTVDNLGGNSATITSASLLFYKGVADKSDEYTITSNTGNPTSIAGGTMGVVFIFTVDVSPTATEGLITIQGTISGTDDVTSNPTSDSDALFPDSWTVQTPAEFEIQDVSTAADIVSQGQTT